MPRPPQGPPRVRSSPSGFVPFGGPTDGQDDDSQPDTDVPESTRSRSADGEMQRPRGVLFDEPPASPPPREGAADGARDDGEPPQREGLPSGFRMRHDTHLVDELSTELPGAPLRYLEVARLRSPHSLPKAEGIGALVDSIRELGLVQPLVVRAVGREFEVVAGTTRLAAAVAAGLSEVPCVVQNISEGRARQLAAAARHHKVRESPSPPGAKPPATAEASGLPLEVIEEVERSLKSIVSSVEMMRTAPGQLLERAGRDLMAAEAHRCDWLIRAARQAQHSERPQTTLVALGDLVERVHHHLEPELRILGVDAFLRLDLPRGAAAVHGDDAQIALAIEGLYRGITSVLADSRGGELRVRVRASRAQVHLELEQTTVSLPPDLNERFFDAGETDRPGGLAAATGLGVARQIFELHGGRAQVRSAADAVTGFALVAQLPLLATTEG